jgi:hypothetical protein
VSEIKLRKILILDWSHCTLTFKGRHLQTV